MSGVLETQQGDAGARASAGLQLRRAREAAGLHVAALAGALKVPVHKLEALEADDYAAFPDTVFMRGLASSICRSLGLDAQPVLDQLPRSAPKGFESQSTHLNAPIKPRAGRSGAGMAASHGGLSRKAVAAVLVLLIGAAAVYFLPNGILDRGAGGEGAPATVSEPAPAPAAATGASAAQPAAPAAAASAAAAPAGAVATFAAPAAVDTTAPAPAGAVPTAAAPAAAAPAAAASAAAAPAAAAVVETPAAAAVAATAAPQRAGEETLVFNAAAPSWVQVKNTHGKVVLSKNLRAGESAQVSAQLPVQVVVGRVAATTLQVRGQPFDLAAVALGKDVARFEVK